MRYNFLIMLENAEIIRHMFAVFFCEFGLVVVKESFHVHVLRVVKYQCHPTITMSCPENQSKFYINIITPKTFTKPIFEAGNLILTWSIPPQTSIFVSVQFCLSRSFLDNNQNAERKKCVFV